MRRNVSVLSLMFLFIFLLGTSLVHGQSTGFIVAWGKNVDGQCNIPALNEGFVAVAGGGDHSLGLKSDGSIVAWGYSGWGQCNVPAPNENFVAVAAGNEHSLGLKSDGSIVAWGFNDDGQCIIPAPNEGFVALTGGWYHSLGLKLDGTIVAWGSNITGQCNLPEQNEGFVAIAGGGYHSLGLKLDGTIVAWGNNPYGQCNVPLPNDGFVAVAGAAAHSLGLKSDGTIVAWGNNDHGQCNVPAPNEDFVALAAGFWHSLGLKSDGTIVAWGYSDWGQCNVPAPNEGFVAVAGGGYHSLGLKPGHPVAVAFSSIAADSRESAIVLHWETAADEALSGFRLYRALHPGDFLCITDSPLSPHERTYEDRAIEPGKEYRYMVAALTLDGREIRSLEVIASSIAPPLVLDQNFPNPFNPQTMITFSLPVQEQVRLDIYDLSGRLVRRLVDEQMQAGRYQVEWDGTDASGGTVASGVYFYRLTVGKETSAKKMIMLR